MPALQAKSRPSYMTATLATLRRSRKGSQLRKTISLPNIVHSDRELEAHEERDVFVTQVPSLPSVFTAGDDAKLSRSTTFYQKGDNNQRKLDEYFHVRKSQEDEIVELEVKKEGGSIHLRPSTAQINAMPARERRLSDAGKPFSDSMPFATVVDVLVFKKLYYGDWNRDLEDKFDTSSHSRASASPTEDPALAIIGEEEEYKPVFEQKCLLEKARSKRKRLQKLSLAGQVAMLKCYDDVIRQEVSTLYPRYDKYVRPTQTPQKASAASPNLPDLRSHLQRAGSILDAVKIERGQRFVGSVKKRPKSKELVQAYNDWSHDW